MRISSARVFSGPCVAGACVGTRSWGAQRVRGAVPVSHTATEVCGSVRRAPHV
jgi:hypothetical protein